MEAILANQLILNLRLHTQQDRLSILDTKTMVFGVHRIVRRTCDDSFRRRTVVDTILGNVGASLVDGSEESDEGGGGEGDEY